MYFTSNFEIIEKLIRTIKNNSICLNLLLVNSLPALIPKDAKITRADSSVQKTIVR